MKKYRLLTFFLLSSSLLLAQNKFTISGTLKDTKDGGDLIGAQILVNELPGTGVITNVFGFYSLTIPEGTYTLNFRYIGYENLNVSP